MPFKDDEELLVNSLTEAEQMSLIEEWDRYDCDQNGTVTEKEFLEGEAAWYERVYGEKIGAEELADKLQFWGRTRDKDKSGEVTWQEYAESKAMLILDQRNALASALTADEVEDAKRVFNAIDRDGGGSISESEARDFFAARAKKDVENGLRTEKAAKLYVDKEVKTLFMFQDADNSGTVDFQEFLNEEAKNIIGDRHKEKEGQKGSLIAQSTKAASSGGDAGTTDDGFLGNMILTKDQIEHAEMKFQDWDTDNSGSLTVDELKKITGELSLKCTSKQFKKGIKKAFKSFDTDGDGSLTFKEFLPVYNFLFLSEMNFDDV